MALGATKPTAPRGRLLSWSEMNTVGAKSAIEGAMRHVGELVAN
jgi:hypothetical protein